MHLHPSFRNYFTLLSDDSSDGDLDLFTARQTFKTETVPRILHDNSLDDLIKELTAKDSPEEHKSASSDTKTSLKIQVSLRMGTSRNQATTRDIVEMAI